MKTPAKLTVRCLLGFLAVAPLCAQTAEQLEAHGIAVVNTTYQGKIAVRIDALPTAAYNSGPQLSE